MKALKRRHPRLADRIDEATPKPEDLLVEIGKKGQPTLRALDAQGSYYLHSPYDATREARTLVDKEVNFEGLEVVVILGVGLGYHVEAVLPHLETRAHVVVVEPDLGALRLAMEQRDLTHLLESEMVLWVVESEHQSAVDQVVHALNAVTIRSWSAVIPPAMARRYMAFAKPFVLVLGSALNTLKVHLATQVKASDLFISNTFRNLRYLAYSPGVKDVRGAWKGRPALLVSAGPSLDQHVEVIRAYQDRILIIAVGQAWRTLRQAGVEPHFVATVDPFDENLAHFDGMKSHGACLLADSGAHPGVVSGFAGPRLFAHSSHSIDILISQLCGPRGVLATGGSVANSAFSFAANLGAEPIILVGQDLAFTGGQTHSTGNVYRTSLDDISENQRVHWREVPGYYGDKVVTNTQMDVFRHWFERVIKNQPGLRVINATEGGARIEGTEQLPLIEAFNRFVGDELIDPASLYSASFEAPAASDLGKELHCLRRQLSDFKALSEDLVHLSGELRKLQDENGSLHGVPGAIKFNSRLKTRFRKFRRLKHPARLLVEAFTSRSRVAAHTLLKDQDANESLAEHQGLMLVQAFYKDVVRACDRATELLEEVLDDLSEKSSEQ